MEYTDFERETLALMKRTDFKNISKSDVMSIASRLSDLRPEVAKDVIAQFPELAQLIHSSLVEYKNILGDIVSYDNESLNQFYSVAEKNQESDAESRRMYYDFAEKVQADCSKCLDNPNLSESERSEILDREMEIFKAVSAKDAEIRTHEDDVVKTVERKDSEKRQFHWETIKAASFVVGIGLTIGISALGGNVNFKLPKL